VVLRRKTFETHIYAVHGPDEQKRGRRYTVTVPALPGCVSEGEDRDPALKNIGEAITGYIETLSLLEKPVPVEVEVKL